MPMIGYCRSHEGEINPLRMPGAQEENVGRCAAWHYRKTDDSSAHVTQRHGAICRLCGTPCHHHPLGRQAPLAGVE